MNILEYKPKEKGMRHYWFHPDGEGRIWWESVPAKNRYDASIGCQHHGSQTQFCNKICRLRNLDLVLQNLDFSFLDNINAPAGWCYIYAIIDKKSGVLKIGKTKRPMKRIKEHSYLFQAYGKSSLCDLAAVFSRNPIPEFENPEARFLEYVQNNSKIKFDKIGNEFFITRDSKNFGDKILKTAISFISQEKENL